MRRRSRDVLTVEQMALVVGVGRQSAYAQCRLYLSSDGRDGIPCHRIGRLILIYRAELETWFGFPIVWPREDHEPTETSPPVPTATNTSTAPRSTRRRPRVSPDQATLPI
jgi:hypothetical protein